MHLDYSPSFANLPLTEIPRFLQQSSQIGEAQMLKSFRAWVKQQLGSRPPNPPVINRLTEEGLS